MIKNIYVCDTCKEEICAKDHWEKKWIVFSTNGIELASYYSGSFFEDFQKNHFCSTLCFEAFLYDKVYDLVSRTKEKP